ncbi:LAMI_0C04984g1_1 [Lachancea mirantina]|uniref:LAMI_0C04984g1_1 n=1 Tax=Lachancea mirantina TaxID=1230905 RepID=A0A1G4J2S3_9SACH|nr:LAMI_0C04984g1_1 [Lachancea mirantina]
MYNRLRKEHFKPMFLPSPVSASFVLVGVLFLAGVSAHGSHSHHEQSSLENILVKYAFPGSARTNALLATLYVSVAPVVAVLAIPGFRTSKRNSFLPLMVALAFGTLMGDILLHMLPEIFEASSSTKFTLQDLTDIITGLESNDAEISEMEALFNGPLLNLQHHDKQLVSNTTQLGALIFAGFVLFMLVDKAIRILHLDHDHDHHHERHPASEREVVGVSSSREEKEESSDAIQLSRRRGNANIPDGPTLTENNCHSHDRDHGHHRDSLKTSAYLSLVSGFVHNVTDGFALASSFYKSDRFGVTTTIAILMHELPHELGESAILLASGLSFKETLKSQIVTTIGALLGTGLGCFFNEMALADNLAYKTIPEIGLPIKTATQSSWIASSNEKMLPITVGGFIYIAAVGIAPDLLQTTNGSKAKELQKFVAQLFAALAGFGVMAWMSQE